jgi:ferredoxin-type protein NapH
MTAVSPIRKAPGSPSPILRHLNKLRWFVLSFVFALLVLLPCLHLYQTFVAAHAYDLLAPSEQRFYDVMEAITEPFVSDPEHDLDMVKGTTWSGQFWGLKLTDPLAVIGQSAAGLTIFWPFVMTAAIPVVLTVIFGRFFCGWICPATFLYELNSNLGALLRWAGVRIGARPLDRRIKYLVLAIGLLASAATGSILVAAIYPPAIVGREIYYVIAQGGIGAGAVFFVVTLLFDLLVSRRGFCRFLCPGGALYALLGRWRAVRIQRIVETCNDCMKCNAVCEFGLDPARDGFGQECNNCTACIAVCPTDALDFNIRLVDLAEQGPGHLGRVYRKAHTSEGPDPEGPNPENREAAE